MEIKYPVLLNSNGEVQDQGGAILFSVKNFFTHPEMKEFGEFLVMLLNQYQELIDLNGKNITGVVGGIDLKQLLRIAVDYDVSRTPIKNGGKGLFELMKEKESELNYGERNKLKRVASLLARMKKKHLDVNEKKEAEAKA